MFKTALSALQKSKVYIYIYLYICYYKIVQWGGGMFKKNSLGLVEKISNPVVHTLWHLVLKLHHYIENGWMGP